MVLITKISFHLTNTDIKRYLYFCYSGQAEEAEGENIQTNGVEDDAMEDDERKSIFDYLGGKTCILPKRYKSTEYLGASACNFMFYVRCRAPGAKRKPMKT